MERVGDTLYIIHAETGRSSFGGPMVLTPDAFSTEEWDKYMLEWRERGCRIVTVVITEVEN